jgi:hypothetical protein
MAGSNNGMTLNQVLGYRTILLDFGTLGEGAGQDDDYVLFDQWLSSSQCGANLSRQVFLAYGDDAGSGIKRPGGTGIEFHGETFLLNRLGADVLCESFNGATNDPNCGEENTSYCVRLLASPEALYDTEQDVDAWGSYCPNMNGFDVYSLNGGYGNRFYSAEDGLKEMSYAQVLNEDLTAAGNYRTVLNGVSLHHLTLRDGDAGDPMELCPRNLPDRVAAVIAELGAALKWGFGVDDYASIPKLVNVEDLAVCQGTWDLPSGVRDEPTSQLVNRLHPNRPNPFNPTTTIRFSLARATRVEILIYDVGGRHVRTLVDGVREAGLHSVVWNGADDGGRPVGSGVFWYQMRAGEYRSNKKMVVLK